MKRTLAIIVAGVLLGAMVVAGSARLIFGERVHTVVIEQEQIQRAIDRRLPLRKGIAPGVDVVLKNSKILRPWDNDQIETSTEFDVIEHGGETYPGRTESEFGLRYDARLATFFLRQPHVRRGSIRSMGPTTTGLHMNSAQACVRELYVDIPVHEIQDEKLKRLLAKAIMNKVKWVDGRLVVSFGY